jgi:DNA-binding NarL/FixJ family response regulator
MEKKNVVIADDHPIFRSGLKALIESELAFAVVGEAADGEQALEIVGGKKPDILVLDYNMPKLNGFAVLQRLSETFPSVLPVMLTMHDDEAMFAKAFELGARGYILKDSAGVDIVNCLHAVSQGQVYASAPVTTYLLKRASGTTSKPIDGIRSLTPSERKILRMIADGKTSKTIAGELYVSTRTVENHRSNISSKLGLSGSHALFKWAVQHRVDLL